MGPHQWSLAKELIKTKIHLTTIIPGYCLACRETCKFMVNQLSVKVGILGREALINAAKTSMNPARNVSAPTLEEQHLQNGFQISSSHTLDAHETAQKAKV